MAMDVVIFSNHALLTFGTTIAAVIIMLLFTNEYVIWHPSPERSVRYFDVS